MTTKKTEKNSTKNKNTNKTNAVKTPLETKVQKIADSFDNIKDIIKDMSPEALENIIKLAQEEKKIKKNDKKININCLIDASGSMYRLIDETINGFNKFISDQKSLNNDNVFVTLNFFNDSMFNVWNKTPLENTRKITRNDYLPTSNTALYDAMGKMFTNILNENENNNIILIITDGEENSSKEFSNKEIKELTKKCEDKGYEIVYLGANQDAFKVGQGLGILRGITANFAFSPVGLQSAYETLNSATVAYTTKVSTSNT